MTKDNPLLEKSLKFAARIVKLHQYLIKEKHETVISKKIANVSPDFTFNDSMLAFIALDGFLKGGIDHILNLQSLMVGDETYLVQEVRRDDGTEPLFLIDTWFVLPCFPS